MDNSSNMIVVNSIFAAIAGLLIVFILQDKECFENVWKWPVALFALSFFLFSLTAERITEAIDEKDTQKHVAYMFLYNLGVIFLFFGAALTINYKYPSNLAWLIIIAFIASFPWLDDIRWLICSKNKIFQEYVDELEGKLEPSPDKRRFWVRFFYKIRCTINRFRGHTESILPHDNIYTRLQRSPIHGVGVFAIRDIPKETNVFGNDETEMVWIDIDTTSNIDSELKRLYADFCVAKNNKYGCPKNFNMLTVGWYLNESKDNPNVRCTKNYDFITLRDIKKGEELTANYSTFSERPEST